MKSTVAADWKDRWWYYLMLGGPLDLVIHNVLAIILICGGIAQFEET